MNAKGYNFHIFSLSALFTVGNTIITMPFYKSAPINLLITAAFSLPFIFVWAVLINTSFKNKTFFNIFCLLVCVFAVYGLVTAVFDYVKFINAVQLPDTNIILVLVSLLVVIALFIKVSNSAILKYCLLVFVFCIAMFVLNFIGGIKNFDYTQIKTALNQPMLLRSDDFLYACLLAVPVLFVFLSEKKTATKTMFFGAAMGFFILILGVLQSVFTLGTANDVEYPYIKAVSVISSGSLFTRLDGFVYFIFFVTALIKAVVCGKTVVMVIKNIAIKNPPDF